MVRYSTSEMLEAHMVAQDHHLGDTIKRHLGKQLRHLWALVRNSSSTRESITTLVEMFESGQVTLCGCWYAVFDPSEKPSMLLKQDWKRVLTRFYCGKMGRSGTC